jgi:hypothetical protein
LNLSWRSFYLTILSIHSMNFTILYKDPFTNNFVTIYTYCAYLQAKLFHCNWAIFYNFRYVVLIVLTIKQYIPLNLIFVHNAVPYFKHLFCINVLTFWSWIYCLFNLYYTLWLFLYPCGNNLVMDFLVNEINLNWNLQNLRLSNPTVYILIYSVWCLHMNCLKMAKNNRQNMLH